MSEWSPRLDDPGQTAMDDLPAFQEAAKDAVTLFTTEAVAAGQLRSIVERVERLEEEKAGIASDIKDVLAEAKANGFDVKVLRKIIALRKRDYAERQEEDAILDLYMQALGMAG